MEYRSPDDLASSVFYLDKAVRNLTAFLYDKSDADKHYDYLCRRLQSMIRLRRQLNKTWREIHRQ